MILLVRADAGPRMGSGHVMRCLALAGAWRQAGGSTRFVLSLQEPALEKRLKLEDVEISRVPTDPAGDIAGLLQVAKETEAEWVVVDGYQFDGDYQRALKQAGLKVLAIDDNAHCAHYAADVILNQNLYAAATMYPNREPHTRLLLGTRYALLRREFWGWRGWKRETPPVVSKILVTMGGGDQENVTGIVIDALAPLGVEAVIVAGAVNPHCDRLAEATRPLPGIQLRKNATDMPELMAWADCAIAAAGSTSLELAFMGLPSCVTALADNQVSIARRLAAEGVAIDLGWHGALSAAWIAWSLETIRNDPRLRASMTIRGRALVDGEGAFRVIEEALHSGRPARAYST